MGAEVQAPDQYGTAGGEVMTMLKVICAWCGKELGEKDGEGVEGISHGICEDCLARQREKKCDVTPS